MLNCREWEVNWNILDCGSTLITVKVNARLRVRHSTAANYLRSQNLKSSDLKCGLLALNQLKTKTNRYLLKICFN